jgi:PAS domain S-box-containing protein
MSDPKYPAKESVKTPALEDWQVLRQQAEDIVQKKAARSPENLNAMTADTMIAVVHELRVHQIELELQNEEMRRAQVALDQAKLRYFELYDLAPVGYLTLDKDGVITEANLTMADMLGITRSSLIKQKFSRYIFAADQDIYYLMEKQNIATSARHSCELRMLRTDGTPNWMKLISNGVANESGATRLIVSDISERNSIKDNLAESKLRLEKLVESAMDAIITLDKSLNVVLYNSAAVTLFGVSMEDAIGMPIDRFIPQRFRAEHADHIRAFGKAGITSRAMGNLGHFGEVVGLRANGEEFVIEASISQFNVEGEKQYTVIMRDISQRMMMESGMQTALAEKTDLLNEVHHRVKNNLQVITSLLRLEAGRSDQTDTKLVLIEMQARIRAMALLHESLYRSGIFASIDLGAYLNQVVSQAFRAQVSGANAISLKLDLVSARVSMDQAMPCGLLVNELISNCFKHAFPEGRSGEIKVSLHTLPETNQLQLIVCDNGIGLPADFEARRGKSLGLQMATDLAKQIGGELKVVPNDQKQIQQGTQFSVAFAIAKGKSMDAHP